MKTLKQHLPVLALTLGLVLSGSNVMQGQSNGHRTTTQRQSNTTTQKREGRTISERNSTVKRGQTSGHRQSSNIQQVRPGGGNSSDRPGGNRPDNGNSQARPGGNRPGGGNSMDRPGGNGNRPGGNRPGHGWNPGHGGPGNNYRPSNSVPPPGAGGYRPSYRPPRQYRWERPVPPPPPRYAYVRVGVPTIGDILGLAFGSLIDYGINSLINIAYNRSNSVSIILDNSITGMTGHQQNPTTGKTLKGDVTAAVSLEKLCEAIGINRVRVVDPYDLAECEKVIKEELAADEPSVIISRRPCILLKYVEKKPPMKVDSDKCRSCKACMGLGCPSISLSDGKAKIDHTICVGCGICSQLCHFDAIK